MVDKNKEAFKRRYYRDLELHRQKARQYNLQLKISVFSLLGNKCVKCGFNNHKALQIDHINGGGSKEKKSITKNYYLLVTKSIVNKEGKYQLLCANCNWIKRFDKNETNNSL